MVNLFSLFMRLIDVLHQVWDFLFTEYQISENISIIPIFAFFGVAGILIIIVGLIRSIFV